MLNEKIGKLIKILHKIGKSEWETTVNDYRVIWLLDQEDGTVPEDEYDTSQERFGITREGSILWGFSSGCSCWDGWEPDDYKETISYKEFIVKDFKELDFSDSAQELIEKKIDELLDKYGSEIIEISQGTDKYGVEDNSRTYLFKKDIVENTPENLKMPHYMATKYHMPCRNCGAGLFEVNPNINFSSGNPICAISGSGTELNSNSIVRYITITTPLCENCKAKEEQ